MCYGAMKVLSNDVVWSMEVTGKKLQRKWQQVAITSRMATMLSLVVLQEILSKSSDYFSRVTLTDVTLSYFLVVY